MDFDECVCAGCEKKYTHKVTMKVVAPEWMNADYFSSTNEYCLDHAMYFAAWLPYCYPETYTLVEITPPASELFGRDS